MKSNFYLKVVVFLMSCSFSMSAQNLVYKEATVSRPAELWKPFTLLNGTNIENGVSFYITKVECNSTKTKLLKVINGNPYPVILSYQLSSSQPIVNVTIPASVSLEGSCNNSDANLAKLSITANTHKSENETEKNDLKQFMLSHITVTKFE
jgi:hypothetical protein